MKIYTEVNYIWKDNKLVQTDSKSFDYEGEVDLCHWYHRHSTTVSVPSVTPKITLPKIKIPSLNEVKDKIPTINEVKDIVSKGPTGGFPKKFADTLYGGSTKDAVTSVQNFYKDFEGGVKYYKDTLAEKAGVKDTINQVTTIASDLLDTDDNDDDTTTTTTTTTTTDDGTTTDDNTLLTGGSTKLTRGPTTWSGEGGTGREGGRKRKDGRLEMSTGSKRASILAPA